MRIGISELSRERMIDFCADFLIRYMINHVFEDKDDFLLQVCRVARARRARSASSQHKLEAFTPEDTDPDE